MAEITIGIASINTSRATELCLRSLALHRTGVPARVVVGDCGSTDASLPMLMRLHREGLVDDVEVAPGGRRHAEWVDHWVASCGTRWLCMLDSDIEIRADGWLSEMLERAEIAGAALCACQIEDEALGFRENGKGAPVNRGERPAMHCVLVDTEAVRSSGRSFALVESPNAEGVPVVYDVGGWVMAGLRDRSVGMGAEWEWRVLRHYRALSWGATAGWDLARNYVRSQAIIAVRLAVCRAFGRRGLDGLKAVARARKRL